MDAITRRSALTGLLAAARLPDVPVADAVADVDAFERADALFAELEALIPELSAQNAADVRCELERQCQIAESLTPRETAAARPRWHDHWGQDIRTIDWDALDDCRAGATLSGSGGGSRGRFFASDAWGMLVVLREDRLPWRRGGGGHREGMTHGDRRSNSSAERVPGDL